MQAKISNETPADGLARLGTDATLWAREFMASFGHRLGEIDEALMLAWFANAIMAGYDERARREENPK